MTKELVVDGGSAKVTYQQHPSVGVWVLSLSLKLVGQDEFQDYSNFLKFKDVRDRYTKMVEQEIR